GTAVAANNIAQWNGTNWSALKLGVNNQVYVLAMSGSNLFVGGAFTMASNTPTSAITVNYISRWDGSNWSALGSGVSAGPPLDFASVNALAASPDGRLYAGGLFATAGGVLVNNVAQWDGFSWHPLALGTSDSGFPDLGGPPSVSALALSGGTLYMGGNFTWVT